MTTIVQKLLVALTSTLIVAFLVAWDSRSMPQIQMAHAHAISQQCNQSPHPDNPVALAISRPASCRN